MKQMKHYGKAHNFSLRTAAAFSLFALCMLAAAVRVAAVASNTGYGEAAAEQSSYSVVLYSGRGTVYDCKGRRLTDRSSARSCVLPPNEDGIRAATRLLSGKELSNALERLLSGFPTTAFLGTAELPEGTVEYFSPIRYSDSLCCHILGYTDGEGRGVCGVERAFDEALSSTSPARLSFALSATGSILTGLGTERGEEQGGGSVYLTIDRDIQELTEQVMSGTERGCAMVLEAETGKLRAMCSRPCFTGGAESELLNDGSAPLLNRALSRYSVGSVFKLCVAMAAIELGIEPSTEFECCGEYVTVSGRSFACHERSGHGMLDMKAAFAESCNVYFYNLAAAVGKERLLEAAKRCGFTAGLELDSCLTVPSGRLPDISELSSEAALCNFSIGQGEISLTPLAVASFYSAAVNRGSYITPRLVEAVEKDGAGLEYSKSGGTVNRVTDTETAAVLRELLEYAMTHGTGVRARPESAELLAGGKTATAQTGRRDGERSILDGWYCGFVELYGKRYVICVVCEDVSSGASDCAPLFSKIADGLCDILSK